MVYSLISFHTFLQAAVWSKDAIIFPYFSYI